MLTVVVSIQVHPDKRESFLAGLRQNARASLREEPGCLRFDVHVSAEDPCRFLLYELYADEAAFHQAHRTAPHYATWRSVVEECVVPGSHVNTYAFPAFPEDIPETPDREEPTP